MAQMTGGATPLRPPSMYTEQILKIFGDEIEHRIVSDIQQGILIL